MFRQDTFDNNQPYTMTPRDDNTDDTDFEVHLITHRRPVI